MTIVSCLPKPRELVTGESRPNKFASTKLVWKGREDKRVLDYLNYTMADAKLGPLSISIEEIDSGFPVLGMDESYSIEIADQIKIVRSNKIFDDLSEF